MASFASAPTVIAVGDRIPACEMHDGFPGVKGDAAKVMIDELCKGARDRSTRTRARAPRGSGSRAPSHTAALPLHPPLSPARLQAFENTTAASQEGGGRLSGAQKTMILW